MCSSDLKLRKSVRGCLKSLWRLEIALRLLKHPLNCPDKDLSIEFFQTNNNGERYKKGINHVIFLILNLPS